MDHYIYVGCESESHALRQVLEIINEADYLIFQMLESAIK